jgi:L-lactate dehydrogenase complex protein LldE
VTSLQGASVDRGTRPARVALFATCLADFAAPGLVSATVEVLEAMGVEVGFPRDQTCCGQPALNSGFPRAAGRVMCQTLESMDGAEAVVTPAGSCAAMIAHHAVRLLGTDAAIRSGVRNLWEFTQFVEAFGQDLDLELDATVTYHDGCHMTRLLGERSTPRALLGRIRGLRLVEMADSDTCCGFGGTFSAKFPELSVVMSDVKLDNAACTGARYVVSADPGCLMQLQTRADAMGRPVQTRHIAEIVRDALRRSA